jgi:hypothetical protein
MAGSVNLKSNKSVDWEASRRAVKVTRVSEKHHFYEVEAVSGSHIGLESACYELVAISPPVQRLTNWSS